MLPATGVPKADVIQKPRVLIVDDEPALVELIIDVLGRAIDCQVLIASNLAQARKILSTGSVEVVVTDVQLPDGDGMSLLPQLREHQPHASAIVITGNPSMDRAVKALRGGAIDFVSKPFSNQQLVDRIRVGIERNGLLIKQEKRVDRLREAVKRLNDSRKMISKKVDLLCNDLVNAYGEISRQLEDVRSQESFRKATETSKDLEQLLCHSMDWLLRELGYCNVAVFLASDEGVFQLGAYMKYTVVGEGLVTEALRRVLVPMASRQSPLRIRGASLNDQLTPQEMAILQSQEFLAVNCTYLGESLASLLFFRDEQTPFSDGDAEMLKQVSPIFAVELASCVRDAGYAASTTEEPSSDTDMLEPEKRPKKGKKNPEDWWKNGEPPPF
jgi:FixJ family two-component response regulator